MSVIDQCNSCKCDFLNCPLYDEKVRELCKSYVPTYDNSEMFKRLLSYKGRIRRLEYCISYLIFYFVSTLFQYAMYQPSTSLGQKVFLMILFFAIGILLTLEAIKRCHDLGHSGWWIFIPFYNLWLWFAPGDEGINEYGADPKQDYKEQLFNEAQYLKETERHLKELQYKERNINEILEV